MTLTKKTVTQIKLELDDLGIVYRSTLRKAELLSLLEVSSEFRLLWVTFTTKFGKQILDRKL